MLTREISPNAAGTAVAKFLICKALSNGSGFEAERLASQHCRSRRKFWRH